VSKQCGGMIVCHPSAFVLSLLPTMTITEYIDNDLLMSIKYWWYLFS